MTTASDPSWGRTPHVVEPYEPTERAALEALDAFTLTAGGRPMLKVFSALATNSRIAQAVGDIRHLIHADLSLSTRTREIVAMRVSGLNKTAYEWTVHRTAYAEAVGLTALQVAATWDAGSAEESAGWTAEDIAVLTAIEQLHATARISDDTWNTLATYLAPSELIEVLFVAGWYQLVSYFENGLHLPTEPWAGLPPTAD